MNAYILSALLFYASFTGRPAYTLVSDNYGLINTTRMIKNPAGILAQKQQPSLQCGDLNGNGSVGQDDVDIYNSLMPPFGWSISAGSKVHWYKDCQYLKGKSVTPCLIENRLCLTCSARKLKMEN